VLAEHCADRLDPEPSPMDIDERHYRCCRRSRSAPKKVAADFKISFARRSSFTSRSNSRISDRSSVVNLPVPTSVFTRRTQIRKVSWLIDNFAEIDSIALHCDRYSP
jgi:hypothetical protein